MGTFDGQTAVVTGASGAIGSAIAGRLIASGARLVLIGRSRRTLDDVVRRGGWEPSAVRCCTADLADEADLRRAVTEIVESCPRIEFLIHAAGAIVPGTVSGSRLTDLDAQYAVNVRAPFQLTQALLPRIVRCGGQVVFINSSVGAGARASVSQYAATKHALRAIADSLRDEVNGDGVRVMSVFLGRTASRMQAALHAHEGREYRPDALLQPDDVASIVVHGLGLPRSAEVTDLHIRPMRKP